MSLRSNTGGNFHTQTKTNNQLLQPFTAGIFLVIKKVKRKPYKAKIKQLYSRCSNLCDNKF